MSALSLTDSESTRSPAQVSLSSVSSPLDDRSTLRGAATMDVNRCVGTAVITLWLRSISRIDTFASACG